MTDFQRFELSVRLWADKLGLHDWEIHVAQVAFPRVRKDCAATAWVNYQQRLAKIEWNSRNTAEVLGTPESIGMHEVLHVLLAAVTGLAASTGNVQDVAVDAEEHAVIKRLMRLLSNSYAPA